MELYARSIHKLVRRAAAERCVLIVLLCLAASISLTRFFLELAGYPQLGNAELHIAHVLWGGLFLISGALLPLLFVNRGILDISAVLSGVGMGLFLDEVGKFITQSNDYFFPAAAPIVYAFFLLTLWIYMLVRSQRRESARVILYDILSMLGEYLDKDLSAQERDGIVMRLQTARELDREGEYRAFLDTLEQFIHSEQVPLVPHHDDFFTRQLDKFRNYENQKLPQPKFRSFVLAALLIWGVIAILYPFLSLNFSSRHIQISGLFSELINTNLILSESGVTLFIRLIGEITIGFLIFLSAILFAAGKEKSALNLAQSSLVISVSGLYLLVFYYDQFFAIVFVILQFVVLGLVFRYKMKFIGHQERQK